jgi:hypothetical protein
LTIDATRSTSAAGVKGEVLLLEQAGGRLRVVGRVRPSA